MNPRPGGHEDTQYYPGLDPINKPNPGDPSLSIPNEPPEPISLWIDLLSLEDMLDPVPECDPQPESVLIDLDPLVELSPPAPEAAQISSIALELRPEEGTFVLPSAGLDFLDQNSMNEYENSLYLSVLLLINWWLTCAQISYRGPPQRLHRGVSMSA